MDRRITPQDRLRNAEARAQEMRDWADQRAAHLTGGQMQPRPDGGHTFLTAHSEARDLSADALAELCDDVAWLMRERS